MKKSINIFAALLVIFALASQCSFAQAKKQSNLDNGYFVLVSNKAQKDTTIVRFYNNDNVMIYEEAVKGVNFNLKKQKVIAKLYEGLENALLAWNAKPELQKDQTLMKTVLARK